MLSLDPPAADRVMEYLPLAILACQSYITEDNLQILCQGLQALDYLHSHSPPLAHWDSSITHSKSHQCTLPGPQQRLRRL